MPLDANTLDIQRWLASYARRRNGSSSVVGANPEEQPFLSGDEWMQNLRQAEEDRKVALHTHQEFRWQQRQAPKESKLDRRVFKERLIELQAKETEAERVWKRTLESLPNYVDFEILSMYPPSQPMESPSSTKKLSTLAIDRNLLYELCLYERICPNTTALTERGRQLGNALLNYLLFRISGNDNNHYTTVWNVPDQMPLSADHWNKFYGALRTPADTTIFMAPSWMTLAVSNTAGKSFLDRELPRQYIFTGPTAHRMEPNRKDAMLQNSWNGAFSSWHDQLITDQYLTMLIVTGPSLKADSRPLQLKVIQKWKDIFMRLIPTGQDGVLVQWSIEAVAPDALEAFESSRLLLKATRTTPEQSCTDKKKKNPPYSLSDETVTLVTISNLESFASIGVKHQSTTETLHMLLVCAAPVSMLLDWWARGCRLVDDSILRVPECLHPWVDFAHVTVDRRIVVGKAGKRTIQHVKRGSSAKEPHLNPMLTRKKNPRKPVVILDETNVGQLTEEQIKAEALSCPFDFLPFHHK